MPNKFDKYPQFHEDKLNWEGLIHDHHKSLLREEDDFDYLHEKKAKEINLILSEEGSDDERSLINSDVTDFSEFYQDFMQSVGSDQEVYTIDESLARGRRLRHLKRSLSAEPNALLAKFNLNPN